MALHIYTSNRMENLVISLARRLATPQQAPLTPEIIVMQSKGMQRWLAIELSKLTGIWANVACPFPNAMVEELFGKVVPEGQTSAAYDPDLLAWRIMEILPSCLQERRFSPLSSYLQDDPAGIKLYQLAARIADSFDQYSIFRPGMLEAWEQGKENEGEEWQAALWRSMVGDISGRHRGQLKKAFNMAITSGQIKPGSLPERISVFGISYLPKYHLEILAAAAHATEINLFLLSPTREYWSDILSKKAMACLPPEDRAARIEGNPLLAGLGRLGRDFSDMTLECDESAAIQEDCYIDPGSDSLLHGLQSDILNLTGADDSLDKREIAAGDISLQIHSCHSPLREVEVLYDALLHLLEKNPDLTPRDILVMTPDIETYSPFVTTVFAGEQAESVKIPFSIADRSLARESRIATLLRALLCLPGGRLTATDLFDILESEPVRLRFGLSSDEVEMVRGWLEETHICWGLDGDDRARQGLPPYSENSWQAGLDRLLLGYAMPVSGDRLFNGILPFDELEGSAAATLGKLLDFIHEVRTGVTLLQKDRTPGEWRDALRALIGAFIVATDETARDFAAVCEVIAALGDLEATAGYSGAVSIGVIREWLSARLGNVQKGLGFMAGGITFCAMLPMRSIPFKVVAMIGMSEGAFPRQSRAPGFDLIASRPPQRGDRSLREEDRYLFLEALISARENLYISYVGQSIKDNSEIMPSVLVSELLDAIDRAYCPVTGTLADRLVTKHRLQAFNPDYFSGSGSLFSYSADNCRALMEQREGLKEAPLFMTTPLPEAPEEMREVSLARLLKFFRNPSEFFLDTRLGIRLEAAENPLATREAFELDSLDRYLLKAKLLEIAMAGGDPRDYYPVAKSRGIIPPAGQGRILLEKSASDVTAFAGEVQKEIGASRQLEPLDVAIPLSGFRLTGRLAGIWSERMIRYRCATLKEKDQVQTWIEHVVLNALAVDGYPRVTKLIMSDTTKTYTRVDNGAELLQQILELYWQGLQQPLKFFPISSMDFAVRQKWDLAKAGGRWEPGYWGDGELDNPGIRLCFGGSRPFDDEFSAVAHTFLEPLLAHQS